MTATLAHGMAYGLAVGLVLGLTGAGGGILAVPALVLGLGWPAQAAAPVALLAVGLAAALGAIGGLRQRLVRWRAALLMAAAGLALSPVGVAISHALPQPVLATLFACAMLLAAARLLRQGRRASASAEVGARCCELDPATGRLRWTARCAAMLAGIGATSGLLTGMLGVGGGFVIVPALNQSSDIRMHGIVATSLMVIALVSIGTSASAFHAGLRLPPEGLGFIAATVVGLMAGRGLSARLGGQMLQGGFALLSILVALALLHRAWLS